MYGISPETTTIIFYGYVLKNKRHNCFKEYTKNIAEDY